MKLRLLPILMTIIVSSIVLFGGWFGYQSFAVKQPLEKMIEQIPGVNLESFELTKTELKLQLKLDEDANLRDIYKQIVEEGRSQLEERTLQIEVTNETSPLLEQVWAKLLFDVAQAMETKQYSIIPDALDQIEQHYPQLKAETEMDDDNVYIYLQDGDHTKYVILPRTPAQLEVWSVE